MQTEMRRPRVQGKFLFVGEEKFWIRGVTYGTFKPDRSGLQFPSQDILKRDLQAIADEGLNAIRVYTVPPLWLMDAAAASGIRVMIGLPWEQHVAFLDHRNNAKRILRGLRESVRHLAGHPAVLCYAVGNEIPPSIVRWYGKARIERFIKHAGAAVKLEDPDALITYVNFPTTEYLDVSVFDFVSFNVYLETKNQLSSYLSRLQNIAGERPLVMTELGLDSKRNGEACQAETLDWQIETAFEHGCAGAFIFAWTDEWFRGDRDVADWDFGLTKRDRRPKQALRSVSTRFANVPFAADYRWPRISVVVCSYNGSRTLSETLTALKNLDYPDYEIIVVDDGSTDQTGIIAEEYGVRLIRADHNGLSEARNLGMNAATGEIVAYIDDDAYPDPHWLAYLASAFMRTNHVGIGGPNIAPPGDGVIAECVANAPGGPVHVLLSDDVAEHIPGCNMAFRREQLVAIGGFDPRFRIAGDDVDICWRLQERGWTLGFAPTAVVWHHRRNSIRGYFKQQRNYAEAEALLADKWPGKYNSAGHVMWQGRLYGKGMLERFFRRARIYHGVWGSAPFQSVYEPAPGPWQSLMLMPEWYFLLTFVAVLTALSASWSPLAWLSPLLIIGLILTLFRAAYGGIQARFDPKHGSRLRLYTLRCLVALFHLVQPAARLLGRIEHGLAPWNWRTLVRAVPLPDIRSVWSERWMPIESRLSQLAAIAKQSGAVLVGGSFDDWDLSIYGGLFGMIRMVAMVEEHGNGRQLVRFRTWPKAPAAALGVFLALFVLAALAGLDGAWVACILFGIAAAALISLIYADCAIAMNYWREAFDQYLHQSPGLHVIDRERSPK
jgi:cellulose synthase/poly-beta-1,6-N-acetylglucosamine synthase-like glycosyltransferase